MYSICQKDQATYVEHTWDSDRIYTYVETAESLPV